MQAWIHAGHDNYLMTPNGRVHRLLTRLALENLFWPFQPFVFGQQSLGPKFAALFDCPLVFYDFYSMKRAVEEYIANPKSNPDLGDVSPVLNDFDLFRDGKAVDRISEYISWYLEGLSI